MSSIDMFRQLVNISTGKVYTSMCDDGNAHAFRVVDDGVATVPICGAKGRAASAPVDTDVVCGACFKEVIQQTRRLKSKEKG